MLKTVVTFLVKLATLALAIFLYGKAYISFSGWQVWIAFFVISFYPFGMYVIFNKKNAKINPSSQKTFAIWLVLLTILQMIVFSIINWFDPIETQDFIKLLGLYFLLALAAFLTFEKVWVGTAPNE